MLVPRQRGHFLYESGFHGDLWMDLEALFLDPSRIEPLASDLSERLSRHGAEIVCGPLVEGAFLGLMVAQRLGLPFTYSERFERADAAGMYPYGYRIPAPLHAHLRGKRVVIVNDVISAGSAAGGTWESLQAIGANPIAIGALLVVGEWTSRFAKEKQIALETLESIASNLWAPEECPLCKSGEPLRNAAEFAAARSRTRPAS